MAITVPKDGDIISAGVFGIPVANAVNDLQSAQWQSFVFPPSLSLVNAKFTGIAVTALSGGASLVDLIALTPPAGWNGPNPLTVLALKSPGLYYINGTLSLAQPQDANAGATYIFKVLRSNADAVRTTDVSDVDPSMGPFFSAGLGNFNHMIYAVNANVCLRLCAYNSGATNTTWSSPGTITLYKLR